jgi:hypothetical protein
VKEVFNMPQMELVCIGSATPVPARPRYQVVDEFGPLRTFWTKKEAQAWMLPSMRLNVMPKVKPVKQFIEVEAAWL